MALESLLHLALLWMTDNILTLKEICRKDELIWRKTHITINFHNDYDSCMAVKKGYFNKEC